MDLLLGILTIIAIFFAIIVIAVFAIRAVIRDRDHARSGSLSSAVLEVQSILEPGKRHVVEQRQAEDEAGDEDTIAGP